MSIRTTVKMLCVISAAVLNFGCGSDSSSFSILPDSETFKQSNDSINTKIDILWVIDNSGSMEPSQTNLSNNFQAFIQTFQDKGYDFQMGVTTTDAFLANSKYQPMYDYGPYRSKYYFDNPMQEKSHLRDGVDGNGTFANMILDQSSSPLDSLFSTNILQGTDGWGIERPLDSIVEALEDPFNSQLLREDSFLAIIVVSDEDDSSTDSYVWDWSDPNLPVQHYLDYLDAKTESSGASRRYAVSNISILDQDCADDLNAADPSFNGRTIATRVQEMTLATKGEQGSLCDTSFSNSLDFIAKNIAVGANQFFLDRVPIEETIVVVVNGISVPNVGGPGGADGFYYDSEANSILFTVGAVPEQGASISINYDPASLDFD